jgi:hypothetical protein
MLDEGVVGRDPGVGGGAASTAGSHCAYRLSTIIGGVLLVVASGIPIVGAASERHRGQPTVDTNHAPQARCRADCPGTSWVSGRSARGLFPGPHGSHIDACDVSFPPSRHESNSADLSGALCLNLGYLRADAPA